MSLGSDPVVAVPVAGRSAPATGRLRVFLLLGVAFVAAYFRFPHQHLLLFADRQRPRAGQDYDAPGRRLAGRRGRHAGGEPVAQDAVRPVIFYPRGGTCRQPWVKGLTIMVNSIYNGWRFEDVWLDR